MSIVEGYFGKTVSRYYIVPRDAFHIRQTHFTRYVEKSLFRKDPTEDRIICWGKKADESGTIDWKRSTATRCTITYKHDEVTGTWPSMAGYQNDTFGIRVVFVVGGRIITAYPIRL